jgi:hypothetical protein
MQLMLPVQKLLVIENILSVILLLIEKSFRHV